MNINYTDARRDITGFLSSRGLDATQSALKPLSEIDFKKLVDVYDHEEHFLRTKFLEYLAQAHQTRINTEGGSNKVNSKDVRTAMLMLGTAVENAGDAQISASSKSAIQVICPYC